MTQFHEAQEVEVANPYLEPRSALTPWRKAKIVWRIESTFGDKNIEYAVQFPDGSRSVFDADHIRAIEPSSPAARAPSGVATRNGFEASTEIAREINRIGAPWAGPMLIFDCETLTGAKDGQGLRFGCFQERGYRYDLRVADADAGILTREKLDMLWHEGLFYEPKNCTPEEIVTLKRYAKNHKTFCSAIIG